MTYTQTQLAAAALAAAAPMDLEEIVSREVAAFRHGPRYAELLAAGRYYRNRPDVREKTGGGEGRSNVRIQHPFYRRLVDQKVRYLLARPWTVHTEDADYARRLNERFDAAFRRAVRRLGRNAVRDGVGWMQPYIGADGTLAFRVLPATEVVPLWRDREEQALDGFLRVYEETEWRGRERGTVGRAGWWSAEGVRYFQDADGSGRYRETDGGPAPHFTWGGQGYLWDQPPLVWLKYNDEGLPLLRDVKDLIDDYDWQTSVTADALRDVAKFVYVLRNYGGEDLDQFVSELRRSLAIQVEGDGGVDKLQTEVDVTAVLAFLDKQRRDLYDLASAVDTKDPDLGSASGRAIAFRYMDLDADCADLGAALQETFRRLKPFLDTWMQARGMGTFAAVPFTVCFNVDMPVDEGETIANITASAGLLSRRTLLANHPWVEDAEAELAALERERRAEAPPETKSGGAPRRREGGDDDP